MTTRSRLLLLLGFGLSLLLPLVAPAIAEDSPAREIDLEWVHKKDDLGIDDPSTSLPGGLRWSPEGHLLAYTRPTDTHGRVLVVLDPARLDARVVLTRAQLESAVVMLAEDEAGADGVTPAGRMSLAEATAASPEAGTPEAEAEGEDPNEGEDEDSPGSISRFSWMQEENRLRLTVDGTRLLFDPVTYRVTEDPGSDLPGGERENLAYSPDDRYAAFTRDNDLYAYDVENGKEIRLTTTGTDTLLNGKFPWVYWEELMWRRTYRAFEWSPAGNAIAFLQFDESEVGHYPVTDFSPVEPDTFMQRYPKVGTANPTVRLGIVSLSSRETRWIDLGEAHEYLIHVAWKPDGSGLTVQTLNRRQNRLGLYDIDPATARGQLVLEEQRSTWVETFESPRYLDDGNSFLWLSERSGFRHLYVATDGGLETRALTSGDWVVDRPGFGGRSIFVDHDTERVYFRATKESPLERHVYRVDLKGGKPRRLTDEPGNHSLSFAADGKYWVHRMRSIDVPSRIDVRDPDGKLVDRLGEVTHDDYAPYRFGKPEIVEIEGPDGLTFYASILKPFDFDAKKKYPVIWYVYGEPAGQVVQNTPVAAFDQVLANQGFVVVHFDGRGTPGRGRDWVDAAYGDQMTVPMQDWTMAVEQLRKLNYVDGERMGVWGWSGGGTMTLNLMLRTPGLFQAGAAVAAVTDKRLYDTIYTEHYLGLLGENEAGYKLSSPLFAADQLEGKLLIAHGISDDNVHVQNAFNLVEALNAAEKDYELFLYPQKTHGIRGNDVQFHLFSRILEFFQESLQVSPGT